MREHADPHLTCILVGNKVDLCEGETSSRRREVSTDEAEKWARKEGLLFLEASAKSGRNVESAFEQASRDILHKIKSGVFDDDRVSVIIASQTPSIADMCYFMISHQESSCQSQQMGALPWIRPQINRDAVHEDCIMCNIIHEVAVLYHIVVARL